MPVTHHSIELHTKQQFEVLNITEEVQTLLNTAGPKNGVVVISVPHTTAAIKLNHFEPLLLQDILRTIYRLVPQDVSYNHDLFELRQNIAPGERSNGHAHVKAFLLGSSETVPVKDGGLVLGDRQNILFVECDGGRKRVVNVSFIGDAS
jgi:secondary thiamine-phosphate synthase enzyme